MDSSQSEANAIVDDLTTMEHEDLADVIEMLTRLERLRLQGMTPAQMAQQMEAEWVDCPGGGQWNAATVTTILELVDSFQADGDAAPEPQAPAPRPAADAGPKPAIAPAPAPMTNEPSPVMIGEPPTEEPTVGVDGTRSSRRLKTALAVVAALAVVGAGAAALSERHSSTDALDSGATTTVPTTVVTSDLPSSTSPPAEGDILNIRIEPPELAEARAAGELAPATVTIRPEGIFFEGAFRSQAEADQYVAKAAEVFDPDRFVLDYLVDPEAPEPEANDAALDKPVLFETGTAIIDTSYHEYLEACGNVLLLNPHITMSISAFTDSTGPEELNLELSQQRAQAIVDFYRNMEVPDGQLIGVGYGESDPVGDNTTDDGRAANRRAMLQLLNVIEADANT